MPTAAAGLLKSHVLISFLFIDLSKMSEEEQMIRRRVHKCLYVVFTELESTHFIFLVIQGLVNLNMTVNILDHISETLSDNKLNN